MSSVRCLFAVVSGLVFGISVADGQEKKTSDEYRVVSEKKDDIIDVETAKGKATFIIQPAAISGATITRTAAEWPETVVIRIKLTGLEQLSISNGQTKIRAGYSSTGQGVLNSLIVNGKEQPLDKKSELWVSIQPFDNKGRALETVPLLGGYFDVIVPRAMLKDHPKSLTLAWIDFFRK